MTHTPDRPEPATPLVAEEVQACLIDRSILDHISRRIHHKMDDYETYNFTTLQSCALNVFFDLAQEVPSLEYLYAVCLLVPKLFFEIEASLFVLDSRSGVLKRCAYRKAADEAGELADLPFPTRAMVCGDRFYVPIKGNHELIALLPFTPQGDIIGVLVISPIDRVDAHARLFFERYANRIGYQLHNRIISNKNQEHLLFIRSLVKDIGHNVIVPNIYFKLYYKRLHAKIDLLPLFESKLKRYSEKCRDEGFQCDLEMDKIRRDLRYIHEGVMDQYRQIYNHYEHTSLFLETLLRRSHFEEGRYVLEKRGCNFMKQVIAPQLERYRPRFAERGIVVDTSLGGVPDQEIEIVADIGLVSQVYANLFSNAVKYAREVDEPLGGRRKFLSYGWEKLPDHFGPGREGIKFNVFSSGPPIPPETAAHLYEEGVRGENAAGEYGTGHGLYFIREVVRLHGGVEGYESTPLGNNFYFILPKDPVR